MTKVIVVIAKRKQNLLKENKTQSVSFVKNPPYLVALLK